MSLSDVSQRLKFLDGLRGVAILLVILYHAFTRWPNLVPYGAKYSAFPVFRFGWLGVELFFMISGFVMVMTLERGSTFREFIERRWLRLFPAMLIASLLIFATGFFLRERPLGVPRLRDSIPGLFFLEPRWIGDLLGTQFGLLDGAFWSLFVEVKFYVVFGLLFVSLRRIGAIFSIAALFVLYLLCSLVSPFLGLHLPRLLPVILDQLSFQYFGWFGIGAFLRSYYLEKKPIYLVYSLSLALLSSWALAKAAGPENQTGTLVAATLLSLTFMGIAAIDKLKKAVELRSLLYIGFLSYPLYLLHQNAMIAMIIKLRRHAGFIPGLLLPLVPILALIIVADIIARWGEPWVKDRLRRILVLGWPARRVRDPSKVGLESRTEDSRE